MLHMERVGIRELRQYASGVLDRVQAGESVTITDRGRPVARIVPEPETEWDALLAAGLVAPPVESGGLAGICPLDSAGSDLSQILAEMRDDDR
jgi:prevent-host-death family protein